MATHTARDSEVHNTQSDASVLTLKYSEQEPWDVFRSRVESLCQLLWPPGASQMSRFHPWKTHILVYLRRRKTLPQFGSSADLLTIERIRGGGFNRVVAVTLPPSRDQVYRKLILRVPRWGQGDVASMVATLEYVALNTCLTVPKVVATDFGNDNPLNSPYTLQGRLPGSNLAVLWPVLTHSQLCSVARQIATVLRTLLASEGPVAGRIQANADADLNRPHTVVPFAWKSTIMDDSEEFFPQVSFPESPHTRQTTLEFFLRRIDGWRAIELEKGGPDTEHAVELWDGMSRIIKDMDQHGIFKTNMHCLCHIDLFPRNIMAEIKPDGSVPITGILDWDEAAFAPKFVCCEPPGWLWGYNRDNYHRSDYVCWPYELSGANEGPLTPENQEIKRVFEDEVGPEYTSMTYGVQYRLCRCLFWIAVSGLGSRDNVKALERTIDDWDCLMQLVEDDPSLLEGLR